MAKKSLLLVDADPRSLRVLEVSLRKAGYSVATCREGQSAIETVQLSQPDLILSDTRLPGMDGFELVQTLRKMPEHQHVPFMFLSSEASVESKVRGLELGVEDYLTKPIYIKEIITRINLTLQRQEREGLARRSTSIAKTRFTGSLGDMGLVDLLQTIDISRKSGVLELTNGAQSGTITFKDGQLVDAEVGRLTGESGVYRLLLWNEGAFEIDFRPVKTEPRIRVSTQALLMEGMRRIDEWGRLLEQIPSLDNVFEVSEEDLVERLAEIPDEINAILRHIDGRRSLMGVIDASDRDDLETLTAITKLYFEGIVYPTGRTASALSVERSLDEEVVPGDLSSEPTAEAEPTPETEGLVPRAVTLPPPAVERANANASGTEVGTDVPEGAADAGTAAPAIPEDREDPPRGTVAAESSAAEASATTQSAPPAAAAASGARQTDPASSDAREERREMARKGRRRRKRREQSDLEAVSPELEVAEETANNVIPFPAQAKVAVAATQVAVNDLRGVVDEPEPARGDASRTVRRDDEAREAAEPAAGAGPEASAATKEAAPAAPAPSASPRPVAEAQAAAPTPPASEAKASAPLEVEPPPAEATPAEATPPSPAVAAEPPAAPSPEPMQAPKVAEAAREESKAATVIVEPEAPKVDEVAKGVRVEAKPEARERPEVTSVPAREPERRKKQVTTSSAEIRAVSSSGEHQVVAESFFRAEAPHSTQHETWDDLERQAVPLSPGMKKAKYATFGILALGALLIGWFFVYNNVVMPQEAPLSHGEPPELPEGMSEAPAAALAAPQPAPGAAEAPPEAPAEPAPAGEPAEATADPVAVAEAAPSEAAAPAEAAPAEAAPAEAAPAEAPEPTSAVAVAEPVAPAAGGNGPELARQAFQALNRRRNQEAADLAQQAVAADPTIALGWLVLGAARSELRDAPGARQAYQSCVEHGTGREVRDCRAMLR